MKLGRFPETRGNGTARATEFLRIAALPAKRASKERRAQRKREKAQRREEQRKAKQEAKMQQQEMKQLARKPRKVTPGKPVPAAARELIIQAIRSRGREDVVELFEVCNPGRTRAAVLTAINKLIKSPGELHRDRWLQGILNVARRVETGEWVVASPPASVSIEQAKPVAEADERISRLESLMEKLLEAFAKGAQPVALPEKVAPVIPIREREQIKKLVNAASKNTDDIEINWHRLYSEAEVRWGVPWSRLARDSKIATDESGWRLDAAEKAGRMADLLAIAKDLFGEAATAARS